MKLRELGEFGLIGRIAAKTRNSSNVRIGIGDDCASILPSAGLVSLITTDMLVEDVHFDLSFTDPLTLGKKSLAVNLSDIAAMGGIPRHFLLSLAIPDKLSVEFVESLIDGMMERGKEFDVSLVGGDTSSSPDRLVISITVIGEQAPDLAVSRKGARPGDTIWVTGTVGDSSLGLSLLKRGLTGGETVKRHLDPSPRVREGIWLAENGIPTSMIDISDGLLADLGHIVELSGVGATIYPEKLPLSDDYLAGLATVGGDRFSLPLSGGEDYELLFTAPRENIPAVRSAMVELGARCTMIGEITEAPGVFLVLGSGEKYSPAHSGYNHFQD